MKRLALIVLLGIAAASAYVMLNRTDAAPGSAPPLAGAPPSAELLARGEYLTKAADCVACHTVAGSAKPYAGGVPFKLPIGTIYSSNITPDPETGIGGWSDEAFVRAVREGVRDDGAHLYPAFPYTSYTQLSRADVLAIKAYLMSRPAVHQRNRANDLSFPFNQRWAVAFWNAAFFKSRRFAIDSSRSAEWNAGAYLSAPLGHCAECHTPRNLGFGLEHRDELAGQELQGWLAYNITADPKWGIGSWSDGDVAAYLKTGRAPGHASAAGPMGEAVANSLQFLNPADVASMVTYLRSVPARKGRHPIEVDRQPSPALAASDVAHGGAAVAAHSAGGQLFEGACAGCHDWNGAGQQTPYAALLGTRSVNDVNGSNVAQAILQGTSAHVGQTDVFMPAFALAYSDTEVAALTNYVIGHFGGKRGTVTPYEVAQRRKL